MSSSSSIPRFAVVGRVNKGKSSILATLVEEADNERIRISPVPGETTRCQPIPLVLGGETLLEFLDTPGFNRARPALDWMLKRAAGRPEAAKIETVKAFVEEHRGRREFLDECCLLEPVIQGAGILYVVDASKPFRPDFAAEMEILRWTGRPRMALINLITEGSDFRTEWRQHLGEYFNLTREFNAHQARFAERIRLLTSLAEIDEARHPNIAKTIQILGREWAQRRDRAAEVILKLLETCLSHRETKSVGNDDVASPPAKERLARELAEGYTRRVKEIEAAHHRQMVALYRHRDYETVDDDSFHHLASDLFAEETWQVFGLPKPQLVVAGALAGAASGVAVDLATGGHTVGLGTVVGSIAGAAGALFKGKALVDLKVMIPGSGPFGGKVNAGGVTLKAGPPKNPNFPWVLLDRALYHFEQIVTRAHGRRDVFVIDFAGMAQDGRRVGRSARLQADERRVLQKWFLNLAEGKAQAETGPVFAVVARVLEEIEDGAAS
ncbi:MAG: DUF3482 domain-containing protein [Verrucomicrobia bacterium]|nr:DUF3482 domain-containing protein [Verrucomicrobiota bacterium]